MQRGTPASASHAGGQQATGEESALPGSLERSGTALLRSSFRHLKAASDDYQWECVLDSVYPDRVKLPPIIAVTAKQETTKAAKAKEEMDKLTQLLQQRKYEQALRHYHKRPSARKHDVLLYCLIEDCNTRYKPRELVILRKAQATLWNVLSCSPYKDRQTQFAYKMRRSWAIDLFQQRSTVFQVFISVEGMDMINFLEYSRFEHKLFRSFERILRYVIIEKTQLENSSQDVVSEVMRIGLFILACGKLLHYNRSDRHHLLKRSAFTAAAGNEQLEEAVLLYETGAVCKEELSHLSQDKHVKRKMILQQDTPLGTFLRSCMTQPRSLLSTAVIQVSALLGGGPWSDRVRRAQSVELPEILVDLVLFKTQVRDYWLAKNIADVNTEFSFLTTNSDGVFAT